MKIHNEWKFNSWDKSCSASDCCCCCFLLVYTTLNFVVVHKLICQMNEGRASKRMRRNKITLSITIMMTTLNEEFFFFFKFVYDQPSRQPIFKCAFALLINIYMRLHRCNKHKYFCCTVEKFALLSTIYVGSILVLTNVTNVSYQIRIVVLFWLARKKKKNANFPNADLTWEKCESVNE